MSPWDTLQRRALVVLHRGGVPVPWSLLCRSIRALLCSGRIKLPKEFLFNLLLSISPSAPPAPVSSPMHAAAARHRGTWGRVCRSTPGSSRLPPPPIICSPPGRSGLGAAKVSAVSAPASPCTGSFSPGHQSLLSGLVLSLLQCVAMNQAQADKARINFAAVWCINTLIINYYKSFLLDSER